MATEIQPPAGGATQGPPRKVVPQRAARETLIKGNDLLADLANRTLAEITQTVNQATSQQGVIVARKLLSRDIVVTFRDEATKEWHS